LARGLMSILIPRRQVPRSVGRNLGYNTAVRASDMRVGCRRRIHSAAALRCCRPTHPARTWRSRASRTASSRWLATEPARAVVAS